LQGRSPQVGLAFQDPLLESQLTVLDNVLLPIEVGGGRREAYVEAASRLISLFGLAGVAEHKPDALSEGMRQRVSLCRALIHNPQILLLDEPLGMLDAITRAQIVADLQRIWRSLRKTVLMITHNIEEGVFLADRVLVLSPRPSRVVAEVPSICLGPGPSRQ
jgi:NitT/TauT family transport system ATP-binding protein